MDFEDISQFDVQLQDHHYYELFTKEKFGIISKLGEASRETSKESLNMISPKKMPKILMFRSDAICADSGEEKPK